MECGNKVWSVKYGVESVECLECKVWSAECKVRTVEGGVWSVEIKYGV